MTEAAATWEPIDSIHPWDRNPRRNEAAIKPVAESIRRFGFTSPIVCRAQDRRIIAGHTRWAAARSLGLTEVPVRFVPLGEAEAVAAALADNRLGEIAEWDEDLLAEDLAYLQAEGEPIDNLGWDAEELRALLDDAEDPKPADDEVPDVQDGPADSVAGQVYELGPHRLWCGDNTDSGIRAAACVGVGAVVTDPPYGIDYGRAGGFSASHGWGKWRENVGWDASRPPAGSFDWMLSVSPIVVLWGGNYFTDVLPPSMGWLVWDKGQREFSLADCELAWTSRQKAARVITYSRGAAVKDGKEHPTQKPIAVMQWTLEKTCEDVMVILDPFGGSGTTLLACASTGRIARLIELDPKYCDVIRRRWTRYADQAGIDAGPGALR